MSSSFMVSLISFSSELLYVSLPLVSGYSVELKLELDDSRLIRSLSYVQYLIGVESINNKL